MSPVATEILEEIEAYDNTMPALFEGVAVASCRNHAVAEAAVRRLSTGGVPVTQISIVGRHFETHEVIQGFYRPVDAALAGAGQGAWYGGLFGLLLGAFGLIVLPFVDGFIVMGPWSGLVTGAIGGAGAGALLTGLVELGVPHDQALRYKRHLHAGEFLVNVHGNAAEIAHAKALLGDRVY